MAQTGTGEFFAVDRATWEHVTTLGLNQAVAYLVLARFTGRDNRHTTASVNAVEKHTGISRGRAQKAIESLLAVPPPPVRVLPREPSRDDFRRGKYGAQGYYAALSAHRAKVAEINAQPPPAAPPQPVRLVRVDGGRPLYELGKASADDAWIWLPNAIVDGVKRENEETPAPPALELLRQTRDVMTLRLFVDLYRAQHLREHEGVDRRIVWRSYDRELVGQQGAFDVWGFKYNTTSVSWCDVTTPHRRPLTAEEKAAGWKHDGPDFFQRFDRLVALGLVDVVPYLFEGDDEDAEAIHAYGQRWTTSDAIEDRLGAAAHRAGLALLNEGQRARVKADGYLWLAPLPRHFSRVQMVGVARLRHRPRTKVTSAWWAELNEKSAKVLSTYERLASDAAASRVA